ncbi:MAG: restriction endonuclease [Flavobacteriales bacterium]|jgi:5-methylcytosine-specific restriction enzyme subunit McrC|nr:restriction endonuclease [Flavobacteriales bacterium]
MPKPIQRFERDLIEVGQDGFEMRHFDALAIWNQRHQNRFFEVEHRRLRCKQFVGVVQVGDVVIEILPKADRDDDNHERWRNALLTMLRKVHGLRLHATDEADLALRRTDLMDLFLDAFVHEVRALVHAGLVKKYHPKRSNLNALKGRLDFPNHLRKNLVHKERFAVVHQAYDTDHLLHSILGKALDIVEHTCLNAGIVGRAQDVNWAFENAQHRTINVDSFKRLRPGRKTAAYGSALQLAKLIILNHNPDLRSGREPVLSILFDMEKLWEKFIHRLLAKHLPEGWEVVDQDRKAFWEDREIKPDLLFTHTDGTCVIADTKWKLPKDDEPSLVDLRQMFAYNIRFVSERSLLIYPGRSRSMPGRYKNAEDGWHQVPHGCEVRFVMPFDVKGRIDEAEVAELIRAITSSESVVTQVSNS